MLPLPRASEPPSVARLLHPLSRAAEGLPSPLWSSVSCFLICQACVLGGGGPVSQGSGQEGRRPAWSARRGLLPKLPLPRTLPGLHSGPAGPGPARATQRVRRVAGKTLPILSKTLLVRCSFSCIRQLPMSSPPFCSFPSCKLSRKNHLDSKHRTPPYSLHLPEALAANLSQAAGVTWPRFLTYKWGIETNHAPPGCYTANRARHVSHMLPQYNRCSIQLTASLTLHSPASCL